MRPFGKCGVKMVVTFFSMVGAGFALALGFYNFYFLLRLIRRFVAWLSSRFKDPRS